MSQPQFGAIVFHLGRMCRYLGNGRYEPMEESLEKQQGVEPEAMTGGMRAALERLALEPA